MNEQELQHHYADQEAFENGTLDHFHYVMREIKTSPSQMRKFELASARNKMLGDAIFHKEFEESLEENKGYKYFIIRVEADNMVLGLTPTERAER